MRLKYKLVLGLALLIQTLVGFAQEANKSLFPAGSKVAFVEQHYQ
jgi:hypothetical protein